MRTVIRYAGYAFGIAIICAILSFNFSYDTTHTLGDNLISFSGNLLLNVVAEFIGLAVGGIIAVLIAKELAKRKLKELAPDLVRLVGHLRMGGTISRDAARDSVICAVHIISEDSLERVRSKEPGAIAGKPCVICDLDYETEATQGKGVRCKNCHLDGSVWDSKQLEEALQRIIPRQNRFHLASLKGHKQERQIGPKQTRLDGRNV
jgi:hypothetical protein